MTRRPLRAPLLWAALAAALFAPSALAADFRSLASAAIGYDAPSDRARRVSIILAGTPVEVVVGLDQWIKVRDITGAITWVERQRVSDRRTVLVNVPRIAIRTEASGTAPVAFEADKDVVLELIEPPRFGWIKVKHADGPTGFAKAVEVWGL